VNTVTSNSWAIDVEGDEASAVIRLAGEFDLYNVNELAAVVDRFENAHAVVVDLTRVTFIDSTVLGCLVRLSRGLAKPGGLVIYGPTPNVRRAFSVSGLDRYFAITDAV
jgi:anti-sigma B factor antagonist